MHKKINAILIPAIIVALTAASLIMPPKSFSERENRYLESFPKLSWRNLRDGDFTGGISDYLSDHFPARDSWIEINTAKSRLQGKTMINGVFFAGNDYLIEKYTEVPDAMEKIARVVNNFCERLENGAKVTFMAVPTSSVINGDLLPKGNDCGDQLSDMRILFSSLSCETIDLTEVLSAANKNEAMFYRLDHHWTNAGAMTAAEALLNNSGKALPTAGCDTKAASESFRGTLFNKVGECGLGYDTISYPVLEGTDIVFSFGNNLDEIGNNATGSLFDFSKLKTADQYSFYLSGNHPVARIINKSEGSESLPKLLVIKDSYANSLIPHLVKSYAEIVIIDPRYFGESVSDYVNANGIDEVLFVYNMNTLGTDSGIRRVK